MNISYLDFRNSIEYVPSPFPPSSWMWLWVLEFIHLRWLPHCFYFQVGYCYHYHYHRDDDSQTGAYCCEPCEWRTSDHLTRHHSKFHINFYSCNCQSNILRSGSRGTSWYYFSSFIFQNLEHFLDEKCRGMVRCGLVCIPYKYGYWQCACSWFYGSFPRIGVYLRLLYNYCSRRLVVEGILTFL